jgi:hypothetical protein
MILRDTVQSLTEVDVFIYGGGKKIGHLLKWVYGGDKKLHVS